MKHVRESLSSFYDYKFFSRLNEAAEEEKEEKEEKPEEKEKEDKPEKTVDNKNDKKEQGELRDKEKDGLAVIDKIKANFEEFKEAAKGEITKYKEFWEENKKTKESFDEGGDIYKMYDSDYVIGVMQLPAETLSDGSIDGGLGATDEPEEEIIEGPEIAPMTQGNELTEDAAADQDFNLDEPIPGEEEDINIDLENPDGGQGDQMDLDTDTQGTPGEVPGSAPAPDMAEPPMDMPADDMGMPPMDGGEPSLTGPQVYFVVYDLGGDGEREEILRTGSNNVVNAFKEFYNDTFKGSMKGIIQKYKEAKEQQKIEAEKTEKKAVEKEKSSKIGKFLGESQKKILNETNADADKYSNYEWEVGKAVSRYIPDYDALDLGDEVGDALVDFSSVIKRYMKQDTNPKQVARLLLADPDFLQQLGLNHELQPLDESLNETLFYAFWQGKKHEIEGTSLWDAKQKAIEKLKVPKSKQGLLAVVSAKSYEDEDFRSL